MKTNNPIIKVIDGENQEFDTIKLNIVASPNDSDTSIIVRIKVEGEESNEVIINAENASISDNENIKTLLQDLEVVVQKFINAENL